MYLKELIIEGFKSYAQKTVIKDFDQHFNAITGLNGSGKSNILDSLIFLLGISGYKDLRASDTRDLIYKQGSAGINTASVTGIFDNSDSSSSPNGYQNAPTITVTRQILHTGANKYFINNVRSTQTKLQELFQSVQLNVANPHFIIMQGRINKVCNMKPHELLKLVEEATGTTMYDVKREQCVKTIEKKNVLVEQTKELLQTLRYRHEQLKDELNKYNELQSISPLVIEKKRLLIAFQYWNKKQFLQQLSNRLESLINNQQTNKELIAQNQQELEQVQNEYNKVNKDLQIKKERQKKSTDTINSNVSSKKNQLKHFSTQQEKLNASLINLQHGSAKCEEQLKEMKSSLDELKTKGVQLTREMDVARVAQNELQAEIDSLQTSILGVGTSNNSSSSGNNGTNNMTLEEFKLQTEQTLNTKKNDILLLDRDIAEHKRDIEQQLERQKAAQHSFDDTIAQIALLEKQQEEKKKLSLEELTKLYSECLAVGSNRDQNEISSEIQCLTLENGIVMMQQQMSVFRSRIHTEQLAISNLESRSQNPLQGNNAWWKTTQQVSILKRLQIFPQQHSLIYGLLVKFIKIKDYLRYGLALEAAGYKSLLNILVDSYRTGAQLLKQNKSCAIPINIVGLDRLHGKDSSQDIQRVRAQCPNAILASSLISPSALCPPEIAEPSVFQNLLNYIFGNTFLVTDSPTAKKVVELHCRAVVIESGDTYEPSGLMSGGSISQMGWLIVMMQSQDAQAESLHRQEILKRLEKMIQKISSFDQNISELSMLTTRLDGLRHRKEQSTVLRSKNVIQQLEQTIIDKKQKKVDLQNEIEHLTEKIKGYEEMLVELNKSKGKTTNFKKIIATKQQELKQRVTAFERAQAAVDDCLFKQKQDEQQITEKEESLNDNKQAVVKTSEMLNDAQRQMLELTTSLAQLEQEQRQLSTENLEEESKLVNIHQNLTEMQNIIKGLESQIIENEKLITSTKEQKKITQQEIKVLSHSNKWIVHQEAQFGTTSQYPFTTMNYQQEEELLQQLIHREEKLQKYNNPLAVSQFEQLENDYNDKLNKYNSLESDRLAIQNSIEVLDEKKIQTVETTFTVVDRYFSSIFSILLPNASSRLKPHRMDGKLVGCEMQIGFSGHWKESLSELSGGQRSLLALSLILALLRCKPAPLYILDEVDAALDVSHTQNIGRTIKEHFQQSQFIIVSLKEGMFENANMLIRTQLGPNGSVLSVTRH